MEHNYKPEDSGIDEDLGLFKSLIDKSNDYIVIVDPETGRFLYVNDSCCEKTGFTREKFLSLRVIDIDPNYPDLSAWKERVDEDRKKGNIIREDITRLKDGTLLPVELSVQFVTIGSKEYRVTILRDITRRKELEKELQFHKELYENIVETIPVCIHVVDRNFMLRSWNNKMEEYTGLKKADVIWRNLFSVVPGMIENDWNKVYIQVMTDGIPFQKSGYKYVRTVGPKKGETVYQNVKIHPLKEMGAVTGILTVLEDVTEQVLSEKVRMEEQKRIYIETIDSLPGLFYIINNDGYITMWNKYSQEVSGYTTEEIRGMHAVEFVPENQRDYIRKKINEAFSKGHAIAETEYLCKDGRKIPHLFTGKVITINGQPHIVGMGLDISEQKAMREELLKAQKLESIGVLAGGIAHDFNNILTGILGNISLVRVLINPADKIYTLLGEAEKAVQIAQNLTRQLLTFSHGGAPVKKLISLTGVIRHSTELALRGTKSRCEYTIPDDLMHVEADEGQISQVINNIIINAYQAMPDGGIINLVCSNITVSTLDSISLPEGRYVKISIKDTGVGIQEEHLNSIFDPYFTTKQKGSGLGLSTSYAIIKKHGGLITVDSKSGIGTTVYIYLPASDKRITEDNSYEYPMNIIHGHGKILLMDDEAIIRNIGRSMLEYLGYEVVFASDGIQAIELYRNAKATGHPFDAVILDLTIPGGVGGKEALINMLKIDPAVRAIVSSGYSDDPVLSVYRRYGFKGMLTKPYKISELSEVVHAVITGTDKLS